MQKLILFCLLSGISIQSVGSQPTQTNLHKENKKRSSVFLNGQPDDKRFKAPNSTYAKKAEPIVAAAAILDISTHSHAAASSSNTSQATSSHTTLQSLKKTIAKESTANKAHTFIYDAYTARRGKPELLELICSQCENPIMTYQKDGPGRLLRCYLDRICGPEKLKERGKLSFNVNTFYNLGCENCPRVLGEPMIYKPENRPAYKLVQGRTFFKKK